MNSLNSFMKPERFDADPNCSLASKKWTHWFKTFSNFISALPNDQNLDKLALLINFIAPTVFDFIQDETSFDAAVSRLKSIYEKRKNEIFARYLLSTRKQESGESLDIYIQSLRTLAKDCNYKSVTADQYRDDAIRDSFITGLHSSYIRQRLLENSVLTLSSAYDKARALESAQSQAESYVHGNNDNTVAVVKNDVYNEQPDHLAFTNVNSNKCFFCGGARHHRSKCPARNAECLKCAKKGHFAKVCKMKSTCASSSDQSVAVQTQYHPQLLCVPNNIPLGLSKATFDVTVNGKLLKALVDSGSTESYINYDLAITLHLVISPVNKKISLATSSSIAHPVGSVRVSLSYLDHSFHNVKLTVLKDLCCDVIIGHDIIKNHSRLELTFNGSLPPLSICSVAAASVEPPPLFSNLTPDCKPIADKSRRYTNDDISFIRAEVSKLLKENSIESSRSPWRAQILVVNHPKKRMVIDYSRTINRFTLLDAYPLPKMDDLVRKIASFNVYSTLDLKSAYHQIPLREEEKIFTAFEADGKLYHFKRIPFGVTNGVAAFQRVIDDIICAENLKDTFAYLDNLTVCGKTQEEHDFNLNKFISVAAKYNLTFNDDKSIISTETINLLGYKISKGSISPDPERLVALENMPMPMDIKALKRTLGFFSYYSKWIPNYSETVYPLIHSNCFPLTENAIKAFKQVKLALKEASLTAIDDGLPFEVETDASEHTIAATLNQNGRPIAFFSRTLSPSEIKHSSIEKEAYAIVESIRKWKHFLLGRHFKLITDQKSVSFMFNSKQSSKIKNEKIQRWRIELSCFNYDIIYRAGSLNAGADALSRVACLPGNSNELGKLHDALCHPGVTRMYHYVRAKNLSYSLNDIKTLISKCEICLKLKPKFFRPPKSTLIKASQPFERLNIDFKGPLPSVSKNKYMLNIIDEHSRFPFSFPCADLSSKTVIRCLTQLFAMFGMPQYVHSDRGTGFVSSELRDFLHTRGVSTSQTTAYNPTGNSQIERYNGIIWKSVTLAVQSKHLELAQWEQVLPDVLHSIRSLLCTATNETPHERLFRYSRKSASGQSLPKWLMTPGNVLMKRHNRASKFDPLVDEVELLHSNTDYAHVKLPDGRETTVSTKHLAPYGLFSDDVTGDENNIDSNPKIIPQPPVPEEEITSDGEHPQRVSNHSNSGEITLRRSTRVIKPPDRLNC